MEKNLQKIILFPAMAIAITFAGFSYAAEITGTLSTKGQKGAAETGALLPEAPAQEKNSAGSEDKYLPAIFATILISEIIYAQRKLA